MAYPAQPPLPKKLWPLCRICGEQIPPPVGATRKHHAGRILCDRKECAKENSRLAGLKKRQLTKSPKANSHKKKVVPVAQVNLEAEAKRKRDEQHATNKAIDAADDKRRGIGPLAARSLTGEEFKAAAAGITPICQVRRIGSATHNSPAYRPEMVSRP